MISSCPIAVSFWSLSSKIALTWWSDRRYSSLLDKSLTSKTSLLIFDFLKLHDLFWSVVFASFGFLDLRIIAIISSIFSMAMNNPIRIWTRSFAFFKSNKVLLIKTFSLNSTKIFINCFKFNSSGLPLRIASVLNPNYDSIGEYL